MILIEKVNNEQDDGLLFCSECGAGNYQSLIRHIKAKHNMTPKEYLLKYPFDKVYLDEMRDKFSKGGYAANKAMKDKGLDFSERASKARKTEIENDPDAFVKRNRNLFKDSGFKERATNRLMKATRWHGDRYKYNDISFRSTWEVKLAQWLDLEGIDYKYEYVKIKYFDPVRNTERTYYIDFYLPDRNLCLEVKPKCYIDDEVIKAKRDACIKEGYKFRFITQDELDNLSINLFNV